MQRYTADANCEKSEFGLKERKKDIKKYKKVTPIPTPTPRFTTPRERWQPNKNVLFRDTT